MGILEKFFWKNKTKHLEVLKIEYDFIFKLLMFFNTFVIFYYIWFRQYTAFKDITLRSEFDYYNTITVFVFILIDFFICWLWIRKFLELRNKLNK